MHQKYGINNMEGSKRIEEKYRLFCRRKIKGKENNKIENQVCEM